MYFDDIFNVFVLIVLGKLTNQNPDGLLDTTCSLILNFWTTPEISGWLMLLIGGLKALTWPLIAAYDIWPPASFKYLSKFWSTLNSGAF